MDAWEQAQLQEAVELIGNKVCFKEDNVLFRIVELLPDGIVKLAGDGPNASLVRRVSLCDAVKRYVDMEMSASTGRKGLPPAVKTLLKTWYGLRSEHETQKASDEKLRTELMHELQELEAKLRTHNQQMAQSDLPKDTDKIIAASLELRILRKSTMIENLSEKITDLESKSSHHFKDSVDACKFFKKYLHIEIHDSTLRRWHSGTRDASRVLGRPVALDTCAEENLLETVLYLDHLGFPISREDVLNLAGDMLTEEGKPSLNIKRPSMGWYRLWFSRMKKVKPNLTEALGRDPETRTSRWSNTNRINWWFDRFKSLLLDYEFARKPLESEDRNGELIWLHPERVIITDEICVNGGKMKTSLKKRKLSVTQMSKSDISDENSIKDCTGAANTTCSKHITLFGGHTVSGKPTVPVWVVQSDQNINDATRSEINELAPKFPALPPVNGQEVKNVTIGVNKKGEITSENIEELILEGCIKKMFPDIAPEPGKRVLWLTGWHYSRLSINLIKRLQKEGVVLAGRLPNTTSISQGPDVHPFGDLKQRIARLRDSWETSGENKEHPLNVPKIIGLAGQALIETFTEKNCLLGLRKTGVSPINRYALLKHHSIQDGDRSYDKNRDVEGGQTLESLRS